MSEKILHKLHSWDHHGIAPIAFCQQIKDIGLISALCSEMSAVCCIAFWLAICLSCFEKKLQYDISEEDFMIVCCYTRHIRLNYVFLPSKLRGDCIPGPYTCTMVPTTCSSGWGMTTIALLDIDAHILILICMHILFLSFMGQLIRKSIPMQSYLVSCCHTHPLKWNVASL